MVRDDVEYHERSTGKLGKIVGYGTRGTSHRVRVLWEGVASPQTVRARFLKRAPGTANEQQPSPQANAGGNG